MTEPCALRMVTPEPFHSAELVPLGSALRTSEKAQAEEHCLRRPRQSAPAYGAAVAQDRAVKQLVCA